MDKTDFDYVLMIIKLNLLITIKDHSVNDPPTPPADADSPGKPRITAIYEDFYGEYIFVRIDSQLHVFYS